MLYIHRLDDAGRVGLGNNEIIAVVSVVAPLLRLFFALALILSAGDSKGKSERS